MFDIKMRARLLIRHNVLPLWFLSIVPNVLVFLSLLSALYPILNIFYSPKEMFSYMDEKLSLALIGFFAFSAVLLFVFSLLRRFYFKAQLYQLLDENSVSPRSFYNISQTARYLYCRVTVAFYKFLWGALFFSPSFITVFGIYIAISLGGSMIKSTFFALAVVSVFLFILGSVFYITVTGRYYLCDYLMFLCPMQPVKDVISSSTVCLKGKLISLLIKRVCIIPWKLFSLFTVTVPFSSVFTKTVSAVICEELYKSEPAKKFAFSEMLYTHKKSAVKPIGEKGNALT